MGNDSNDILCPICEGEGIVDSGGVDPQGNDINIPCGLCRGSGYTNHNELEKAGWKKMDKYIKEKDLFNSIRATIDANITEMKRHEDTTISKQYYEGANDALKDLLVELGIVEDYKLMLYK